MENIRTSEREVKNLDWNSIQESCKNIWRNWMSVKKNWNCYDEMTSNISSNTEENVRAWKGLVFTWPSDKKKTVKEWMTEGETKKRNKKNVKYIMRWGKREQNCKGISEKLGKKEGISERQENKIK